MVPTPSNTVKLGSRVFSITRKSDHEMEDKLATIDLDRGKIVIADYLEPAHLAEVFLHEVCHYLVKKSIGSYEMEPEFEEQLCLLMAPALMAFFETNPDWIKWILKITQTKCRRKPNARA